MAEVDVIIPEKVSKIIVRLQVNINFNLLKKEIEKTENKNDVKLRYLIK